MAYDLTLQKRLAATILKVGPRKIRFDPARLNDIKAAITKADIRQLISDGVIKEIPVKGISRGRARKAATQRSKGLRKGAGHRKGTVSARQPRKEVWMARIRAQRKFLKELKDAGIIKTDACRQLYAKSKGGFFRSIRHIKLYINERGLVTREAKK